MHLEEGDALIQEQEDQKVFLEKGMASAEDAGMPAEGVLIHSVYRTVHRASEDCAARCGVTVNDRMFTYSLDVDELFGCRLCWRPGCAPWERTATVPALSVRSDSEDEAAEVDPGYAPTSPADGF